MRFYPTSQTALLLKCKNCGHEWTPRFYKKRKQYRIPNICPKCKTPYWNTGGPGKNWRRGKKGAWKHDKGM